MNFTKVASKKYYYLQAQDNVMLEVSDKDKPDKFRPHLKFKRWDEDASISVELKGANGYDNTETLDKLKWKNNKHSAEIYHREPSAEYPDGGAEFSLIFDEKPASNIVTFDIKLKNCDLYYQGPMTDMIGQMGIVTATETEGKNALGEVIATRPINVCYSYAMYYNKPFKNRGAKTKLAGKMGHIYRPKVIDANLNEAWCEMLYDEQKKELSITMPQAFLDSAVYPVILDPTFGYSVIGGSSAFFNAPGSLCHIGAGLIHAATNDRVIRFYIYGNGTSYNTALYTIAGGLPVNRLAAAVTVPLAGAPQWNASAVVSQLLANGNTYGQACGNANNTTVYFDLGAGNQRSGCATNLPAVWASTGVTAAMYSWYAEYEELEENVKLIN